MLNRTLAVALSLIASSAGATVPEGSCALIVAARRSLSEVQLFERQNPQLSVTEVYEASNGWYAISVGLVAQNAADQRLADPKSSGAVSADSYCSKGEGYIREVSRTGGTGGKTFQAADTGLEAPFDARPMSIEEKRFLQSALAFLGYYAGILDGQWGRGSQEALDRFAFDLAGAEATNADAALLMMVMEETYGQNAWQYRYFSEYGVALFVPLAGLQTEGSNSGLALEHLGTGISVYMTRGSASDVSRYHQRLDSQHDGMSELYQVREPVRWVTAATWDGKAHYVRSENRGGTWTSVFISAPPSPESPVNLVVGIVVFGQSPVMALPQGGYAQAQIAAVAQVVAQPSVPAPDPAPREASASVSPEATRPTVPVVMGSGRAFYIDPEGHALTNAHVIEGCQSVALAGTPAEVLAVNEQSDLAVLASRVPQGVYSYLAFGSSPAALNSDVTVAGFPLQPVLGGLNVTRGAVSSLSGLHGDIATMQITAPVQPGNSGGPVVSRDGRVVGVVVAKFALEAALERFGSVPENVNFAIRSDIAKLFLNANGFTFEEEDAPRDLSPEDLAGELQKATMLVECFQ